MWVNCPNCKQKMFPHSASEEGLNAPEPKVQDIAFCTNCLTFITFSSDSGETKISTKPEVLAMLEQAYPYIARLVFIRWVSTTVFPQAEDAWDCRVLSAIAQKV